MTALNVFRQREKSYPYSFHENDHRSTHSTRSLEINDKLRILLSQRFPALASRDFAIFWVGHLILAHRHIHAKHSPAVAGIPLSGRPFDLGLIGFAVTLPTFFLAIPGGVLIEHVDKRKAIIVLQTIMMLDTFVLASSP